MDVQFDDEYCIYLRKSRKDQEAESRGEGETLARHENMLLDLAAKLKIVIRPENIYREIVSGETIAARPEVQRLLSDVEHGRWKGVLVVEVERLARGDTSDQGMVAKAFKRSSTKIITPTKTYNPDDEFDEEYFEFSLFMSRREFKTINRRLQRGRLASVDEGKFVGSVAPYGYRKVKIKHDKGYTLEIIPDQANVVRMMYEWYTKGLALPDGTYKKIGATRIADELNNKGFKPSINQSWSKTSVTDILKNPIYAGKIRWGYRKEIKFVDGNNVRKSRTQSADYKYNDGLHDAIIDIELFHVAQQLMSSRGHAPVPGNEALKNPFTGLIYCGKCGRLMTRLAATKKTPYDTIKCMNVKCDNVSSPLYLIEEVVLQSMQVWLSEFKAKWKIEKIDNPYSDSISMAQSAIDQTKAEINKLIGQRDRLHDLLEQGIYSTDIFLQRNNKLSAEINDLEKALEYTKRELESLHMQSSYNDIYIPKAENLLSEYYNMEDATMRNEALKELIDRITYTKNEPNKKGNRDNKNFEIMIDPKVVRF
jgi:site-specific DNA recombinase